MPDGESTAEESGPVDGGSFDICVTQAVAGESSIAFSDVGAAAESSVRAQESEKDLRKVPRRYVSLRI